MSFWGTPIPVWKSDNPQYPRVDVFGSVAEIKEKTGFDVDNLHKPYIDEVVYPNPDDPTGQSMMQRVPDVFDCWFFLNSQTPINANIVENRMGMPLQEHIQHCIDALEQVSDKTIMNGLGELTDGEIKKFAKTKLRKETISLLGFFKAFPILA